LMVACPSLVSSSSATIDLWLLGSAPRSRCNLGAKDSPFEFLPTFWSASSPRRCSEFPFQFHACLTPRLGQSLWTHSS
jgi:hypothetical protein